MAKRVKDLDVCIAELQVVQRRGELDSEQVKYIEAAIEGLRLLRRKPHLKQRDAAAAVRTVAKNLLKAFVDE
jgi:hypothetical protein